MKISPSPRLTFDVLPSISLGQAPPLRRSSVLKSPMWYAARCLRSTSPTPFSSLPLKKLLEKKISTGTRIAAETQKSAAPSTSSKVGCEHEVFLSFRGTDTRKTFTDYLYEGLIGVNIETFIDREDLHIGESIGPKLIKAIKNSKISIPIFSQDYASSEWCLREVFTMVECMKNEGQLIFPIFYDVEPSHVRHQKGSYKEAFKKHEHNFPEEVEGWKKALKEVANLSGLEVGKTHEG